MKESDDHADDINPWELRFMSMFHMGNDSNLFHSEKDSENLVPLFEGKLIRQFDSRWATFDKIKDNGTIEERLVSQQEKEDLEFKINPRYWVTSLDVREKFIDKNGDKWWKKEGEENFVGDSEIIALGGASNETKDRPLG